MKLSPKAVKAFAALRRRKLLVGLTGPIGAGKSAALEEFARAGAFTVSADALARSVLTSPACYSRISRQFGPRVFLPDGSLDRKNIGLDVNRINVKSSVPGIHVQFYNFEIRKILI